MPQENAAAPAPTPVRIAVRVRPRAPRSAVGGRRVAPDTGGSVRRGICGDAVLLVAVAAPAVDGRANAAVCAAVAAALGVRLRDVAIVSGARSRNKILEIVGDRNAVTVRVTELLGG